MNRDEARSEIRLADSFSAELQMFIDYVREGHSTRRYAEGHISYLEDAIDEEIQHLEQAAPAPDAATAVHQCLAQLKLLRGELTGMRGDIDNRKRLAAARETVGRIRQGLAKANSLL